MRGWLLVHVALPVKREMNQHATRKREGKNVFFLFSREIRNCAHDFYVSTFSTCMCLRSCCGPTVHHVAMPLGEHTIETDTHPMS
jgi:hypothetical protein